jgi:hypothetical protein
MTPQSGILLAEPLSRTKLASILRQAWQFNRILTIFMGMSIAMTLIGILGMLIDPRIVLGMPNWAKSTKFGMSLTLYGAALLWMLPMLTLRPRLTQVVANGTGAILILESILIMFQALRGVPMHFNVATPLDTALWGTMSITIGILWLITALGVGLVFFQKLPNRVLSWSIRLGFLITLVGFAQGFLMTSPNATQLAALQAGQQVDLIGAHTVGRTDGGPGIPLLGWSTTHGDLRIGHFIGIHALQAIPLLGVMLLRRRERWLSERTRLAWLCIGAASYFGLMLLVTWQALRGQPLFSPDPQTIVAGAVLLITLLGTALLFVPRTHLE